MKKLEREIGGFKNQRLRILFINCLPCFVFVLLCVFVYLFVSLFNAWFGIVANSEGLLIILHTGYIKLTEDKRK